MMAGRPRNEATPEQRLEIERLGKRMGRPGVIARTGYPKRLVERELALLGLRPRAGKTFTPAEDAWLMGHAGEQLAPRLQNELAKISGTRWPLPRIKQRIVMLMALGLRDLRAELTLAQAGLLIGRSEQHMMAEVKAKRLKAQRVDHGDGRRVRLVTPSVLRAYVLADKRRVDWLRAEVDELVDLIARKWGAGGKPKADA